jgi:hypothetical protein
MHKKSKKIKWMTLLAASSILVSIAPAQSPTAAGTGQTAAAASAPRHQSVQYPKRQKNFYQLIWGVDSFAVKYAESGEAIRFSYRVLDPNKAKILNDNKAEPALTDPEVGVRLVIPSLENIGLLRQTATPEAGKSYWMVFSNKGRLVRPGHRISVTIGTFRVDNLVVQ